MRIRLFIETFLRLPKEYSKAKPKIQSHTTSDKLINSIIQNEKEKKLNLWYKFNQNLPVINNHKISYPKQISSTPCPKPIFHFNQIIDNKFLNQKVDIAALLGNHWGKLSEFDITHFWVCLCVWEGKRVKGGNYIWKGKLFLERNLWQYCIFIILYSIYKKILSKLVKERIV